MPSTQKGSQHCSRTSKVPVLRARKRRAPRFPGPMGISLMMWTFDWVNLGKTPFHPYSCGWSWGWKQHFRVVDTVHKTQFCRQTPFSQWCSQLFCHHQSSLPGVSGGHAEPRGSQWLGQLLGQWPQSVAGSPILKPLRLRFRKRLHEVSGGSRISHLLGDRSSKPVLFVKHSSTTRCES